MTARVTAPARDAEKRLEREYEPLKAETLRSLSAKLRARGLRLAEADLEDYYNQAWHALYAQEASGTEIANAGGFLVQVGFRRAIDDMRRLRPDERAPEPLEEVPPVEPDVVQQLDDQRRLREFTEALREQLGERERVAASLCYIHGYTRPEAAKLMGLGERRMQKVMDAVAKAIARITEDIRAGNRCKSRESLNKAYALGLLGPDGERYAAARAHLDECPRCRADVLGLRGLASVAPAPLLPWAALPLAAGAGGGTRPRRPRRPNPTTAAAVAAAVVIAAGAGIALTRTGSEPEPRGATAGSSAPASDPPSSSGSGGATGQAPSADRRAERERAAAERERESAERARRAPERRRRAARQSQREAPVSTPAPTSIPAPVSTAVTTPPPAPTPSQVATPAPTATAEPPVLDDGVQEFGVEP